MDRSSNNNINNNTNNFISPPTTPSTTTTTTIPKRPTLYFPKKAPPLQLSSFSTSNKNTTITNNNTSIFSKTIPLKSPSTTISLLPSNNNSQSNRYINSKPIVSLLSFKNNRLNSNNNVVTPPPKPSSIVHDHSIIQLQEQPKLIDDNDIFIDLNEFLQNDDQIPTTTIINKDCQSITTPSTTTTNTTNERTSNNNNQITNDIIIPSSPTTSISSTSTSTSFSLSNFNNQDLIIYDSQPINNNNNNNKSNKNNNNIIPTTSTTTTTSTLNKTIKEEKDKSKIPKKRKTITEEDESGCGICFDYFHSSSGDMNHQASTLKCGHIYGKSCLYKWVEQNKTCPMCLKKSNIREIITLYLPRGVCEVNPNEDAIKLRKLLISSEKEIESLKKKLSIAKSKLLSLSTSNQPIRDQPLFKNNNNPNDSILIGYSSKNLNNSKYINNNQNNKSTSSTIINKTITTIPSTTTTISPKIPILMMGDNNIKFQPVSFCKLKGSNVFDFSKQLGVVVASYNRSNNDFGFVKISSLDSNSSDFIYNVHKEYIRDIKISNHNESIACSVSQDKTVKLFNINTKNLICSYQLQQPGKSCQFDQFDSNIFYASGDKSTFIFDIRNTFQPFKSFDTMNNDSTNNTYRLLYKSPLPINIPSSSTPDTPLSSSSSGETQDNKDGGVFVANNQLIFYEKGQDYQYSGYRLNVQGQCVDIGYDQVSNNYLASFRQTPNYSKSSHLVFKHHSKGYIEHIKTIFTDSIQSSLSRSIIFSSLNNNNYNQTTTSSTSTSSSSTTTNSIDQLGRCYTASSNESIRGINIWNVQSGRMVQSLVTNETPCDLIYFSHSSSEEYLLSLSPQILNVFKNEIN